MNKKLLLLIVALFTSTSLFAQTKNITDYGKALAKELGIEHVNAILKYGKPVYAGFHFIEKKNGEVQRVITKSLKEPAKEINIYFLYRPYPLESDEKQSHKFFLQITSYANYGTQDEKEIGREFVAIVRPKSKGSSSSSIKSFLFNDNEKEPIIKRFTYYRLTEYPENSNDKIEYQVDFEISEKPIE